MKKTKLVLLSLLHLLIDGVCAYTIFSSLYTNMEINPFIIFVLYNCLAFLLQPFIGLILDKATVYRFEIGISVVLLLLGYLFRVMPYLSASLLGIANALFHVSGGKIVAKESKNNIISLGIFVSLGGIGLAIGSYYLTSVTYYAIFISLLVITCIYTALFNTRSVNDYQKEKLSKMDIFLLIALCLVVFFRSYVGKIVSFDWANKNYLLLIIAISATIGKILGGVCAHFFSIKYTTIISMILGALALLLNNMYLNIIGICLLNFTMPITLYLINKILKNNLGLAFGLLAFMLIPGYFLAMIPISYTAKIIFVITAMILSMILILIVNLKKDEAVCL